MGAISPGQWQFWQFFYKIERTSWLKATEAEFEAAVADIQIRGRQRVPVAWSYHKPRWVFMISRPWWNRKAGHRRSSPVCHPLCSYLDGDVFEQPLIPRALFVVCIFFGTSGLSPALKIACDEFFDIDCPFVTTWKFGATA